MNINNNNDYQITQFIQINSPDKKLKNQNPSEIKTQKARENKFPIRSDLKAKKKLLNIKIEGYCGKIIKSKPSEKKAEQMFILRSA
jgi:hypothetical protein